MAKIKKIVTSQVEARVTADRIEPNTYSYDTSGVIIYHDNNSKGAAVQAPGIIYGANGNGTEPTGLNTIRLIPHEDLGTDQYLIIEPTDPEHIHIRAGGAPDNSTAELILGAENTNVKVVDSSSIVYVNGPSQVQIVSSSGNINLYPDVGAYVNDDQIVTLSATQGLTNKTVNGIVLNVAVRASSLGIEGDVAGFVSYDESYHYYCTGTYDGTTNIWKRIAWSGDTWPGV